MIGEENALVKSFRMARDFIASNPKQHISLRLFRDRPKDPRVYNIPTIDEVAGLIIGDFDSSERGRDIIISDRAGSLQRIHETHPSFLPLQYPILFPYGEDGYKEDISFFGRMGIIGSSKKEKWCLCVSLLHIGYMIDFMRTQ